MFVANQTPMYILSVFMWNPLFHTIDQTRGYMFLNYDPRYSSVTYPIVVTCVLIVIGLLIERYTEKHASLSWSARR
jgi:ABC-type polysaccharide/polyol phosphate export permease